MYFLACLRANLTNQLRLNAGTKRSVAGSVTPPSGPLPDLAETDLTREL